MKLVRILVSLSMLVMAGWILLHFILMWIFGSVVVFEDNIGVRAFETFLFSMLVLLGSYALVKEWRLMRLR